MLFRWFLVAGPFNASQQGEDRLAGDAVENQNRLEAGAAVVRVEQRQLLLAVHRIVGVVDVEHDARWRACEAAAVEIYLAEPDTGECAPAAIFNAGSPRNASTSSQSS